MKGKGWMVKRSCKLLIVLEVIMLLSLLFGCKKSNLPPSSDAEQYVKKHLDSKYEQNFEILSVKKENIGHLTAKYIYSGTACVAGKEDAIFEFTVEDKTTIKDNYPNVLFAEQAEKDVTELCAKYEIPVLNLVLKFIQTDATYLTYDEYIANQNVVIKCEVEPDIGGNVILGKRIYMFASECKEKGLCFDIGVKVYGNSRYLMHVDNIVLRSEEEWNRMLNRE